MPGLIVMKFGGTSVADAERIKRAARRIVEKRELGNRVVAVLSARGKTTDELITMAEEVSPTPDPREMDMLLSTGERISCALCAMAINDLGHRAISLTGSQAGIVTDESHTKARILDVRAERIRARWARTRSCWWPAFRASRRAPATSPRSAAAARTRARSRSPPALGAEVCEIYTDVAGVYSADPRIVPDARKLDHGLLRGDARDGGLGRRRAAAALGRVRAQPRRAHPLPLVIRRGARYRCARGRRDRWSSH